MKLNKAVVLAIFLISLLAITVASQIPQAATISLEEAKTCSTNFYDEAQPVYSTCVYYHNVTNCLNTTGPNTQCSVNQIQSNFRCKTNEITLRKNSTECNPLNKFTVTVARGSSTEKKEIDFSSWGVCVNSTENGCLVITCGTLKGGSARNGIFNGCDGGKACQKFLFCQDGLKVLYKASRDDFVKEDPTFHLSKLAYREVTK